MKKKILFITTRNPYSGRYSGDVIRSLKIINLLKKKYSLDVLCFKNDKENILTNRNFIEEFTYDVQSDKFGMAQYEENITNNLNSKISNDIIILLGTLK